MVDKNGTYLGGADMRYVNYLPNTILRQNDLQDGIDNGVVQINSTTELASVSAGVNVVFCLADYEIYKRIAPGTGSDKWELF